MFLGRKLETGGAWVYTAEALFATNKDLGGSLKTKNAGGRCATQRQSQDQIQQESDELTEMLGRAK